MTIIGTNIDTHPYFIDLPSLPDLFPSVSPKNLFVSSSVSIRYTERTSGLYILGKPRMGKSWLLINMILQDITKEKGVFFIDPHGEAIDQLVTRANSALSLFSILDFENDDSTLTINPLGIDDFNDPSLRNDAFAKTKALFDKLWKNTFEEKPWLQLILQNTIYTFIENQEYRLTEFPMFFSDRDFRNYLVQNMRHNIQVKDYWQHSFASKDKRDQERIMEAAQTRCEIMLAHPAVRHLFGSGYYRDIGNFLTHQRGYFVKLSTRLPYEVKKIIGTGLINELIFGIQKRKPGSDLFCIYIDEFQNFVSFEDMATLITQAPKFGISTTLAHHERFGQLEDDKRIIGATSTIANKVLFQITGKDAHDFAPEFRKDPPEVQDGDIYVISQSPFYDLLQGHNNPRVRELVDKYLRPIKERAEDLYGDRETERLIRTEYLDEANMYRVDERIAAAERSRDHSLIQGGALGNVERQLSKAKSQVERLKELNEEAIAIRATIRILTRLFIDMMDGKLNPGQEKFSNKLIEISKAAILPPEDRPILELYISIAYGPTGKQSILPFDCAKRQGLFRDQVEKIEHAINTEWETKRNEFARRIWRMYDKHIQYVIQWERDSYNKWRSEPVLPGSGTSKEHEDFQRLYKAEEWGTERENRCIERQRSDCSDAIKDYEQGNRWYTFKQANTSVFGWDDEVKIEEPLIRRQPTDFTIESSGVYVQPIKSDLIERGFTGIVESIDGLVELCRLLGQTENYVQVQSKQSGKKVQPRTIADMTNEMEGELTELAKYTAYAKVLQGKEMWKGKIRTHQLPTTTYTWAPDQTRFFTNDMCCTRKEIEEAIRTRQENWRPRFQEPEKPIEEPKKPETPKKDKSPKSKPPPTSYD